MTFGVIAPFSVAMVKHSDRSNLRRKKSLLVHSSKAHHGGKVMAAGAWVK